MRRKVSHVYVLCIQHPMQTSVLVTSLRSMLFRTAQSTCNPSLSSPLSIIFSLSVFPSLHLSTALREPNSAALGALGQAAVRVALYTFSPRPLPTDPAYNTANIASSPCLPVCLFECHSHGSGCRDCSHLSISRGLVGSWVWFQLDRL
jgi:hypothetical protein